MNRPGRSKKASGSRVRLGRKLARPIRPAVVLDSTNREDLIREHAAAPGVLSLARVALRATAPVLRDCQDDIVELSVLTSFLSSTRSDQPYPPLRPFINGPRLRECELATLRNINQLPGSHFIREEIRIKRGARKKRLAEEIDTLLSNEFSPLTYLLTFLLD